MRGLRRGRRAVKRGHSSRIEALIEELESRQLLTLLIENGDFVDEVSRLKNLAFSSGSNQYVAPTVQEQSDFSSLASALLNGDLSAADTQAAALGYEVVEFTDSVSGAIFHGLREQMPGGVPTRGWGSYFANLGFSADALVEVPHPLFDTDSWDVGARTFQAAGARGFLMAGAHRNTNGTGTADVAHLNGSVFQTVHEAWVGSAAATDTWQIHGFDDANHAFPAGTDAVLSNGDGSVSSEVITLDQKLDGTGFLSHAFNTLAVSDPLNQTVNGNVDGNTFASLGGTTNVQGAYSRSLGGRFLHTELEQSIRFDATNRQLAATAIGDAILSDSAFQISGSVVRSILNNPDQRIGFGADWNYLDDGSDQGTAWTAPGFDDSTWSTGPAQLGYGDGDEATVTSSGFATTYFRHDFNVENASAVSELDLSVIRDDGVAVYLNGTEILRDGLAVGAAFSDFATQTIANAAESTPISANVILGSLPAGTLVDGQNTLSAEVHQVSLSSSDISFDLSLETLGTLLQVHVDFSSPVDASSVDVSDLLVNGLPVAEQVTLDDTDTATFTFPLLAAGTHSLEIAAGSMNATDGTSLGSWSRSFEVATEALYSINHSPRLQLGDAPLTGYSGSTTDQIELLWQTVTAGGGTQDAFSVEYRLASSSDAWMAGGGVASLVTGSGSRIIHSSVIDGLDFDTEYEYRVRHWQADVIVDEYTAAFRTRLPAGESAPFRFVAYGDSAYIAGNTNFELVQNRINTIDPDFVLTVGDMAYNSGTHDEYDARFDPLISPAATAWAASHIDYMAIGNHDIYTANGQPTEENYSVPVPVAGVNSAAAPPASERPEHNYSFDYGDVHFLTFDTNAISSNSRLDSLLDWAVADLNASTATWKVVFGHHAVAGSPDKSESPSDYFYQQVVSRLGKDGAGVDLLLMGHSHTHHSSYPLTGQSGGVATYVNDPDRDFDKGAGLVQVVSGVGGKSLRSGTFPDGFIAQGFSTSTTPAVEYGFAQIDVTPTRLTVQYIAADDGAVLDEFSITAGVDTTPPTAQLKTPQDNGTEDLDSAVDTVLVATAQSAFEVQLSDSTGVDDTTVTSAAVSLTRDSISLVESVDYTFSYDSSGDIITLSPTAGSFPDGEYLVTLNGGAATITDTLGNSMSARAFSIAIDTSLVNASFQQGVDGYLSTIDTMLQEAAPTLNHSSTASLNVDSDDPAGTAQDVQSLIVFDDILGTAAGQIPPSATIQSATLELNVTDPGSAISLHRMLADWTASSSWSSLVGGVSADGIEAVAAADAATAAVSTGTLSIDVLASLQAWQLDPASNQGWVLLPTGTNGVDFDSAEGSLPPRLDVVYSVEPSLSHYESFESALGPEWNLVSVDPEARVQVRDLAAEGIIDTGSSLQFTQNGNSRSLVFDSSNQSGDAVADLGLAIWSVDLSGFSTEAVLTFHQYEGDGNGSGDENNPLPIGVHATNAPGDGVSISVDGSNWYELFDLSGSDLNRSGDGLWQLHEIDLAGEIHRINSAYGAGLSFSDGVQFKWSQYDENPLPTDGWAIDEIRILEQASEFSASRPRGAFHQFSVPSEDDSNYFYRAAVFGDATSSTPILVSTHGDTGAFDYDSYARDWHRFVNDPANGVDSVVVVTPVFVPGSDTRYDDHHTFGWNRASDAAADLVLLETVDAIAATGFGDASQLYLFGFSAGGQFTNRFTAAHPDRVAAAVVGGAGVQMLPTVDVAFPRGFGERFAYPLPTGVTLDIDSYLANRIQFWVGENDNDPNHSQIDQSAETTSVQGSDRVERAANQFAAVVMTAEERGIDPTVFEHELFIAADRGHTWTADDLPQIADFLFRDRSAMDLPIGVHARVVSTPTMEQRRIHLPQNLPQLASGQQFFVELWVTAPSGSQSGVLSGQVDVYVDPEAAILDPATIEHGTVFDGSNGYMHDPVNDAGFVRGFTGTTAATGVGVGEYALFGRLGFTAAPALTDPAQLVLGLQRSQALDFQLETQAFHRTDFQSFDRTIITDLTQGILGTVFEDSDGDGIEGAGEARIADRSVELQSTSGTSINLTRTIEPDDQAAGSYLNQWSPWASLSAAGTQILSPGVRAFASAGNASTGSNVFSYFFDDGVTTSGVGSLWRSGERELRVDFHAPVSRVSLDAIGTSANDVARLRVYDSADTLLAEYSTATLSAGAIETMTLMQPNIAYAIATGVAQTVRLDNLRFDVQPLVTTDGAGEFRLQDLDPGSFNLVADVPTDWTATSPSDGTYAINILAGQVMSDRHFGQRVAPPPPEIDDYAISEVLSSGTRSGGDYASTHSSDNVYEALTEILYSGNKRSRLEHQWTFNVTGGNAVEFHLEAHHDSTVEDFTFEYSTGDGVWTPMITVTKNADDGTTQVFELPVSTSGTVLVRTFDTDRSRPEQSLDTLFVDHMFIRSRSGAAPPQVTIMAEDANAGEAGPDPGSFLVSRTGETTEDLVVFYSVAGSATAGSDYEALAGTVTVPAGQTSAAISLLPLDDAESEGTETVQVIVSTDAAYTIGSPGSATVSIADDESSDVQDRAVAESTVSGSITGGSRESTFASDDSYESITEELFGGRNRSRLEHRWQFNVTGGESVTFSVEAWHDSAVEDFILEYSTDQTVWIPMLTVTANSDANASQTHELPSSLSGTTWVRVIDSDQSRGENTADTIRIDDMFIRSQSGSGGGLPQVSVAVTDGTASEAGGDDGEFTISRTGDTASDLIVFYSVSGTAEAGQDYGQLPGSLTIPAGQAAVSVPVFPLDDGLSEGNETVVVSLTADASYSIGSDASGTVSIVDDEPVNATDFAQEESSVSGSISGGSYLTTHASDNSYEVLTEERYSGNKRSRLEHRWQFSVTGGTDVLFVVEAHHDASAEDFRFEYSTDAANWLPMLSVTKNVDDDTAQSFAMPAGTSGTVFVRALDTDQTRGESVADSLYVDSMYFESSSGTLPGISPSELLIFYAWPSTINGAASNAAAALEFARYDRVVLGEGLEKSTHGDHANTVEILADAAVSATRFYGYIDLGVTTQNLPMSEIQLRIDEWKATGVDGIFLDDFGYDFGVTRDRQNAAIDYAHEVGMPVVANAWDPADAFGDDVNVSNPSGTATRLGPADFYLSESYQIIVGEYQTEGDWQTKATELDAFRSALNFRIWSTTTNDSADGYDQTMFEYAWYSALLHGHESTGWGEFSFSSDDSSAPFRTRPTVDPGTVFMTSVENASPLYTRDTDTGQVFVNTSLLVGGFNSSGATNRGSGAMPESDGSGSGSHGPAASESGSSGDDGIAGLPDSRALQRRFATRSVSVSPLPWPGSGRTAVRFDEPHYRNSVHHDSGEIHVELPRRDRGGMGVLDDLFHRDVLDDLMSDPGFSMAPSRQ